MNIDYKFLKLIESWCVKTAGNIRISKDYRQALNELQAAVVKVARFH